MISPPPEASIIFSLKFFSPKQIISKCQLKKGVLAQKPSTALSLHLPWAPVPQLQMQNHSEHIFNKQGKEGGEMP